MTRYSIFFAGAGLVVGLAVVLGTSAFAESHEIRHGASVASALSVHTMNAQDAPAPKPCVRTSFKSKALADKCKTGGQKAAKKYMKALTKKGKALGKVKNCKTCHTTLSPKFELTDSGLKLLQEIEAAKDPAK